jgi:hypothetical protein
MFKPCPPLLMLALLGTQFACSTKATGPASNPSDVSGRIRESLDRAGFTDVSAGEDRATGGITLGGFVASRDGSLHAGSIAKSIAPGKVISDEIVIVPPGQTTAAALAAGTKIADPDAAVAITTQNDPRSQCKDYMDVYLTNTSSRTVTVDIRRSNNVDNQTTVLSYAINPDQTSSPGLPWVGGPRNSSFKIGCLFEGTKTYNYTVTQAAYR